MAEHDLTKTIIPYLDRHLAFPLLAHLVDSQLFPVEQVQAAQYELAKGTNMVDYAVSLFTQLYPDQEIPEEFSRKRERAVSTNERLQQEAQAVLDVIENPDVAQALRQDKNQNLTFLKDNYNVTLEQINALYNFGQFQYTYGNYSGAADYLYHFRVLSTDNELNTSAHWGKLASDILTGKWDTALEELNTLRDVVDSRSPSSLLTTPTEPAALAQLHSRTWLAHWSLFVYFNHPQGQFLDNARYLISEAYCRIHQRIDIGDLSERLNLSRDEGEKWIVNLIRETRMGAEAKIDLEKNVIEIHRTALPVYQTVIEKTRGLAFRTQALGAGMLHSQQAVQSQSQPSVVDGAR
ncbi:hypothetical protein PISMIDRAFT_680018 [Pisolithus microcarpus 441]|uniref:Eukaryotic translation initiation factor 3 subunit E n=1 Tax=Pisolithus microcarpus 441 TaxID=765257 RepID=A0A0C9Z9C3_9AGAM|nr:hypothetical protein PISMIDRAFT_680018 [Pisolithus microcarpus 441]